MSHFLNQRGITLRERLRQHIGFPVAVRAEGFSSEPGGLQYVGRQFMKVNNVYFVPLVLQEISLYGFKPEQTGFGAWLRTEGRGTFQVRFLQTGMDYVEVIAEAGNGSSPEWLLIPLGNVISIERAD